MERINTTIQISDTGISPGSGVGNNRKELSRATLGADVIAIGVPTVVDAVTMANDTLDITLSTIRAQAGEGAAILQLLEQLSPQEKYGLLQEGARADDWGYGADAKRSRPCNGQDFKGRCKWAESYAPAGDVARGD